MNIEPSQILEFYEQSTKEKAHSWELIPPSGSDKRYYRIFNPHGTSFLVSYNEHADENEAYISFTHHFEKYNLHIARLYHTSTDKKFCMIEDLGNIHFLDLISQVSETEKAGMYEQVLEQLIQFQFSGLPYFPFESAYPVKEFDAMAMKWDLNYFKYNYLKLCNITYNELKLEQDFDKLIAHLQRFELKSFMYRDFQARNIMQHAGKFYFIDYQGGRKGNPWYDLVSLLFQAKANLSDDFRLRMAEFYSRQLPVEVNKNTSFEHEYYMFALLRILQTLGAYGLRGIIERKPHFMSSIEIALKNLKKVTESAKTYINLSELYKIINQLS